MSCGCHGHERFRLKTPRKKTLRLEAGGFRPPGYPRNQRLRTLARARVVHPTPKFSNAGCVRIHIPKLLHSDSLSWKWMAWSLGRRLSFTNRGCHPLPCDVFGVYPTWKLRVPTIAGGRSRPHRRSTRGPMSCPARARGGSRGTCPPFACRHRCRWPGAGRWNKPVENRTFVLKRKTAQSISFGSRLDQHLEQLGQTPSCSGLSVAKWISFSRTFWNARPSERNPFLQRILCDQRVL